MFEKCMGCSNYGGTSLICAFACERVREMKKGKNEHCKKSDCLYYDHKNYSNNCSASATQHKRKYGCRLYLKKKEEVKK